MQNAITQIGNYSFYNTKIIGKGATGLVYLGFRNQDKLPIAVKAIKLQDINTPVKKHLLDCEVLALKTIKHRYICQAYDVLKDNQFYYVPMQHFTNGTLRDYILKKGKLGETQALEMFEKIVQAYCKIRELGFMHRDLKSQNILLRTNNQPGIIDFGYCEKIDQANQKLTYNVGSPAYMSPEAYNESIYSQKSDIWALGVVLHEMVTGTIPHMRTTDVDEYFRYLRTMKNAEIVSAGQSQNCNSILRATLTVDTRFRCSAIQLLNMVRNLMSRNFSTPKKSNTLPYEQYSPVISRSNSTTKVQQRLQFGKAQQQPIRQVQLNPQPIKNWKFVPQQQINLVQTPRQADKFSTKSNCSSNSQQQSPILRQTTANNPSFMQLRKRIQSNVNFNLNLTPVRNEYTENNPYQFSQSVQNSPIQIHRPATNMYRNEPMTAQLPPRIYAQDPNGTRMKKSNSFGNMNVQLVHRF